MTEHDDSTNEDPITGKGPTNAGLTGKRSAHDDAAWFRAHVDPVIGDDVPDGWDEIQSRATGRQALMIPLPKAEVRAWPGRRLVAVAALLLVVVGMVGIGLKLVGSNDDDQIPAGGEDDHATGFYIPGTLPPGWTVTKLSMDSVIMVGIECPCDVTEIRRDDGDGGYVAQTSAESPPPRNSDEVRRYPLEGRSGWFEQGGDTGTVIWRTATGSRSISSPSLHRTELEALADDWTSTEPPVLDGYQVIDHWSRDQPAENRQHSVSWTFTSTKTEQNLNVTMGPALLGTERRAKHAATLPGNGLLLGIVDDDPEGVSAIASWPGDTEIFVMSLSPLAFDDDGNGGDQATPPPDWTTVQAVLGSFEPADAGSWSDYLDSAPVGGPALDPGTDRQDLAPLRSETISDWLVGPEPGNALPKRTVQVVQNDPEDPAAAITAESNVDVVSVAEGEPFTIELTLTNRTGATLDVSGCSFGSATWSLIDEQGLVTPAGAMDVDCDPGPYPWPDGEQRTQTFEFPGWGPMPDAGPIAAVIEYGDNLSQGVTVVIPGGVGG